MSQKIKSITVIKDFPGNVFRINREISLEREIEAIKSAVFNLEKYPEFFEVQYEQETPKLSSTGFYLEAPKNGTGYWFVSANGNIANYTWEGDEGDNEFLIINNCFVTQEAAQKQADKRKVKAELERFAAIENGYWKPSSTEEGYKNWCIGRVWGNKKELELNVSFVWFPDYDEVYFASKEIAQKAIDTITPERLKLLFS